MYMTRLKALLTDALASTFDADYVNPKFRNLHVSIEFPEERQAYPGVWVDWEPQGEMEIVGIAHTEVDESSTSARAYTRWRFQGYVTYTVAALTSLERDDLLDELIRVFAFGRETVQTSEFRAYIEDNDLLAINIDFDQIAQRGFATSPGTPWQTDEMIYEGTLALEVVGEFISDSVSATLAPLTSIEVTGYTGQADDPEPEW